MIKMCEQIISSENSYYHVTQNQDIARAATYQKANRILFEHKLLGKQ